VPPQKNKKRRCEMKKKNMIDKIEEKVLESIRRYKKETGFRGFNPVWSGLNDLLRRKGFDPREVYQKMQEKGLILIRPMRVNGKSFILLYLPEDAPSSRLPDYLKEIWEGL
jgi:hypothetical protein